VFGYARKKTYFSWGDENVGVVPETALEPKANPVVLGFQGADVPHLFCPRSAPGASFRNARIPMTLSAYGKGTLNECTNRNHQEVRDRL